MKKLLLFRHAKSDWTAEYGKDHDRPLAARGTAAAQLIGRFLQVTKCAPDVILSSSAVRAVKTAQLAAEAGRWQHGLLITDKLYSAPPAQVIELASQQPSTVERLMLVGHNPTWEETAGLLMKGGIIRLPTAAVACFQLSIVEWNELLSARAVLQWLVTPKLLKKWHSSR